MESFKRSVLNMRENLDTLESRVSRLEGVIPTHECHYVSTKNEFGITEIDYLDTFRFQWKKNPNVNSIHLPEPQRAKYIYTLENPSESMKQHTNGYRVLPSNEIYSNIEPSEFQSVDEECWLYIKNNQFGDSTSEISKKLCEMFDEYMFDVAPAPATTSSDIPKVYYKQEIELVFKNKYKIPPHVNYYITPFDNKINKTKIIELTTKRCVIEISFGEYVCDNGYIRRDHMMPTDTELHWMVDGVVDEPPNIFDTM